MYFKRYVECRWIPLKCHYIQLTKLHCESCFSSFAAPPHTAQWRCCAWIRQHLPFLGLRRQTPGHISLSKTIKENRFVFGKIMLKKFHLEKTLKKFSPEELRCWQNWFLFGCRNLASHHFGTWHFGKRHFGMDISSPGHFGTCMFQPCGRTSTWTFRLRGPGMQ